MKRLKDYDKWTDFALDLAGTAYNAWGNYPVYFFEKARETKNQGYLIIKNVLPITEGLGLGGLGYLATGDSSCFKIGPIAAMVARHLQTRNHVLYGRTPGPEEPDDETGEDEDQA